MESLRKVRTFLRENLVLYKEKKKECTWRRENVSKV